MTVSCCRCRSCRSSHSSELTQHGEAQTRAYGKKGSRLERGQLSRAAHVKRSTLGLETWLGPRGGLASTFVLHVLLCCVDLIILLDSFAQIVCSLSLSLSISSSQSESVLFASASVNLCFQALWPPCCSTVGKLLWPTSAVVLQQCCYVLPPPILSPPKVPLSRNLHRQVLINYLPVGWFMRVLLQLTLGEFRVRFEPLSSNLLQLWVKSRSTPQQATWGVVLKADRSDAEKLSH